MEKNVKKTLTIIAGTIGAVLGTYAIVKTYKKSVSEQRKVTDEKKKELESLGIPKESAEELVNQNSSVSTVVYKICRHSDEYNFPEDAFSIKDARASRGDIIHVKSDIDFRGREIVDIIFEIPNYTKNGEKYGVGDYISSINGLINEWQQKFDVSMYKKLCGFVVMQYQMRLKDGETAQVVETIEINPEVYGFYKTETRDGLTAFYEDLCRTGKLRDEVLEELGWQIHDLIGDKDIESTVSFNRVFLGFKITFPIKRWRGDDGITAVDVAYFVNSAYNHEMVGKKTKTWDYVMFHPSDDNGEGIMNLCIDSDGTQEWLDLAEED